MRSRIIFVSFLLLLVLIWFSSKNCGFPISSDGITQEIAHEPSILWVWNSGDILCNTPAIGDINVDGYSDVILSSYGKIVYALDGRDGSVLWTRELSGNIRSSPVLGDLDKDGLLEIALGNYDNHLYVLNSEDGGILWSYECGGIVTSSPTIGDIDDDDQLEVVFGSYDHHVYALEGFDGSLLWSYKTEDWVKSSPAQGDINGDGKIEIIVGSHDHNIYALDGESGTEVWVFSTAGEIESSPALGDVNDDGILDVVIGSRDKNLYVINGSNGTLLWAFSTDGWIKSSPALADLDGDEILEIAVGSHDGNLYALDGDSGSVLWVYRTDDWIKSSPAIGDLNGDARLDVVIGSYDGRAYIVNGANGSLISSYTTNDHIESSPILCDLDMDQHVEIIICSYDNHVYVLDFEGAGSRIFWQGGVGSINHMGTRCVCMLDKDGDMLSSYSETLLGLSPNRRDSDRDGMPDGWEIYYSLDPFTNDAEGDLDGDGITNYAEYRLKLDPTVYDGRREIEVIFSPKMPTDDTEVMVLANLTGFTGVEEVILSYSTDLGATWSNATMIFTGTTWNMAIPPQPMGTTVLFKIHVRQSSGEDESTALQTYIVKDIVGPIITASRYPIEPGNMEPVKVSAQISDLSGVLRVILSYSVNNELTWKNESMGTNGYEWYYTIPGQASGVEVQYKIYALDSVSNWAISEEFSYTVSIEKAIMGIASVIIALLGMIATFVLMYREAKSIRNG